jgi:hypothetical protein
MDTRVPENIVKNVLDPEAVRRDYHLPADICSALVASGWLRPPVKVVSIKVIPLNEAFGGWYTVSVNDDKVAVFAAYQDAIDYQNELRGE